MPESDPKTGPVFIWIISCILFICITVGGGCLLAYITTTDPQPSPLLPIIGFILVCMPWIFWISTLVYRLTSRAFGFRMVIGDLYYTSKGGGGGGGGGGSSSRDVEAGDHAVADMDGVQILDVDTKSSSTSSSAGNNGRQGQGQFDGGAAVVSDDHGGEKIGQERNNVRPGSSSTSSIDTSVASHESELPLALSMIS